MLRLPLCAPVEKRNEPLAHRKRPSAAAIGVIDKLVEPHAGFWPNVQVGLVVKAQACNASLVGADGLVSMDAATNRERPGDAAVSGRRDAMGRTDLLLSGLARQAS